MSEESSWVEQHLLGPEPPSVHDLPATYPWKRFLSNITMTPFYKEICSPVRGALFTGPAGNGRHTQGLAFTYSLMEKALSRPGNFDRAFVFLVQPSLVPPELPEGELMERMTELFETLVQHLGSAIETITIVFDQLDLYPLKVMDRIADLMDMVESNKLFVLCIAENEHLISRKLKLNLIHCRCNAPNERMRTKYLEDQLMVRFTDRWSDSMAPKEKSMVIEFSELPLEEIVRMTEGFSYADLSHLGWMFRLMMCEYDLDELKNTSRAVIHPNKETLLLAIEMCTPARRSDQSAQPVIVQQLAQSVPQNQLLSVNPQATPGSPASDTTNNAELDIVSAMDLISRTPRTR